MKRKPKTLSVICHDCGKMLPKQHALYVVPQSAKAVIEDEIEPTNGNGFHVCIHCLERNRKIVIDSMNRQMQYLMKRLKFAESQQAPLIHLPGRRGR